MKPGGPESLGERKEAPQITVIERICRNVEVVEIDGARKYRVTWKAGIAGVEGAKAKKGEPVVCLFDTAEQVIHQHERVLENYLGVQIPLAVGEILKISGETQKMAGISTELSSLAGQFIVPFIPKASLALKEKAGEIRLKIGQVTNAYKLKAQAELERATLSEDEQKRTQAVLDANLAILERAKECLGIVGGVTSRLRIVTRVKNKWEQTITQTFYELARIFNGLQIKNYEDPKKREQLTRHISGESEWSLIGKLNAISGPEYWQRIQSREVQGLCQVGDLLREGKDERIKILLARAILKLERVVKEGEERKPTPTQTGA